MKIDIKDKNDLRDQIHREFQKIFSDGDFSQKLKIEKKSDKSFVTHIDYFISKLFEDYINLKQSVSLTFVCEEKLGELSYPAMIIDPIDGTFALVHGQQECCVSVALMNSSCLDDQSWAWIYNPFTGFEMSSNDKFVSPINIHKQKLLGFVSRSEWKSGLYGDIDRDNVEVVPKGSIAFKLALLASGACDFVVTLKPKNIWDIAAGTILLKERGYELYHLDNRVEALNKIHMKGPLIWCKEEFKEKVFTSLNRPLKMA